jgi:hypothetical protein
MRPFLTRRLRMKHNLAVLAAALLIAALSSVAVGQDKVTPQEVVAKVKEAANTLSKTGDLAQFNQKQGPWMWKDTYIFIQNCDTKVIAAHPIKPESVGKDFMSMKDGKGNALFVKDYCDEARKPSGVWSEFWWPKPGETQESHKLTYSLSAKGTPYVVVGSLYSDTATIEEMSKLTSKK